MGLNPIFRMRGGRGGGVKKNQYIGGNYLKRETLTVCRFMEGGLGEKERGGVFFLGRGGGGGGGGVGGGGGEGGGG